MAIAYSNKKIVFNQNVRADSQANLRQDITNSLASANWSARTPSGTGYKYVLTSPEGFQCKVLIEDAVVGIDDEVHAVIIQFMTPDEAFRGFRHQLVTFAGAPDYQLIAGICQLWISRPGATGETSHSSAAGGVLARSRTVAWWSCGEFHDFRTGPICGGKSSYFSNGQLHVDSGTQLAPLTAPLCLHTLSPQNTFTGGIRPSPIAIHQSLNPLTVDAMVGWEWQVRGKLWDAFCKTTPGTLDLQRNDLDGSRQIDSITWHTDYYSSLYLLTRNPGQPPSGVRNYAY